MKQPQLILSKRFSPDNPDGNTEYYLVMLEDQIIYGSKFYAMAEDRFRHIQEIGYKAYIAEIAITSETILSEPINYPELIEAMAKAEAERKPDAVIDDIDIN